MAVMLTTAGEACLKRPMVDFSSGQSSLRGETVRGAALGSFKVALTIQACRPATNVSDANTMAARSAADAISDCAEVYSPFGVPLFSSKINRLS
jgi:hypothetical protein